MTGIVFEVFQAISSFDRDLCRVTETSPERRRLNAKPSRIMIEHDPKRV